MDFVIEEVPLIPEILSDLFHAPSFTHVAFPVPNVLIAILVLLNSKPVSKIVFEVPFVLISALVEHSLPILHIAFHLPAVVLSIDLLIQVLEH